MHLALLMMVKNEEKRILVSLESIKDVVNSVVIYDTGSVDSTIDIITKFCKAHSLPLRLKQGEFVDFSTSRNESIEFAETFDDIDYLLLMDCNDELRGSNELLEFLKKDDLCSAYMIQQQWLACNNLITYYNVRLIKSRFNWRFKGVVHEYIYNTKSERLLGYPKCPDNIILYQNRNLDDDKSQKRFIRDQDLLLQEHLKNPDDPRTVFYLAQTYGCLRNHEKAYEYYLKRSKQIGFFEEVYHSHFRLGESGGYIGLPWETLQQHYLDSLSIMERVEPLIKLAEHYREKKQWFTSFMFINQACNLPHPICSLNYDKYAYDYQRYHLMGIIAWYCGRYNEGIDAIRKLLINKPDSEIDLANLKFYEDALKEKEAKNKPEEKNETTKKKFISNKMSELKVLNPSLTQKQLEKKALMNYKLERRKLKKETSS